MHRELISTLNTRGWIRVSILNLLIVALLGTLMRYKIGFEFPHFNQKNLQHAHSHFAFIVWITQLLFVLITDTLLRDGVQLHVKKYRILLLANVICAYGMLFSFAAQGYKLISISLSCASIFISWIFAFTAFRDLARAGDRRYRPWFTAGLWFNIISSLGTFTLGFMMATHNFDQHIHLGALYYYLHFQYNGFFTFVCLGLLVCRLSVNGLSRQKERLAFWLFFLACVPAYFLSVLWAKLPGWVFVLMALAAVAQVVGWVILATGFRKGWSNLHGMSNLSRVLLFLVAAAFTAKLLLQLGSMVPALSKLAFGFRPVVIAYLHLILLAIISVFLISYLHMFGYLRRTALTEIALSGFVAGVYLNEIVLGVQGIASFSYTMIPYVNEMLFAVAVLILLSLILLYTGEWLGRKHASVELAENRIA